MFVISNACFIIGFSLLIIGYVIINYISVVDAFPWIYYINNIITIITSDIVLVVHDAVQTHINNNIITIVNVILL